MSNTNMTSISTTNMSHRIINSLFVTTSSNRTITVVISSSIRIIATTLSVNSSALLWALKIVVEASRVFQVFVISVLWVKRQVEKVGDHGHSAGAGSPRTGALVFGLAGGGGVVDTLAG